MWNKFHVMEILYSALDVNHDTYITLKTAIIYLDIYFANI